MSKFKALPIILLLLCAPALGFKIQSPVIRDHDDLDNLLTDAEIKTQYEANANTNEFSDNEKLKLDELNPDNGGAYDSAIWTSDTTGTVAPPGDRTIRWNNATQSSATELFIDDNTKEGTDVSAFFASVVAGDIIRLQLASDASVAQLFSITSVTDNTTYFTFGVTNTTSIGGNIADAQDVLTTFVTADTIPKHASSHQTAGDDSIPVVTGSVDGLMIAADKTKIDTHWDLKTASEGAFEVFAGTPGMKTPDWDSSDLMAYVLVTGGAADDQGGLVYEFIIPQGVTAITEVKCTGKLGVASEDVITYRVKREDGTQIETDTITAITETVVTMDTFSPSPTLVAGTRIIVEAEYQGDSTETGFIGSCQIEMAR